MTACSIPWGATAVLLTLTSALLSAMVDEESELCGVDTRSYANVIDPRERISALGYGEYDLTDHPFVFAGIGVSR